VSPNYTDEQIRELCARALVARGPELEALISELRIALRNRTQLVSNLSVGVILQMPHPTSAELGEDDLEAEAERKDGT